MDKIDLKCFIFYCILYISSVDPKKTTNASKEPTLQTILALNCFVDKSNLIKEFLSMNWQTVLLTAPKNFGKTTNIRMLKMFLEIKNIYDGQRDQQMFENHWLDIFKDEDFFWKHYGQYPVIHIDLKSIKGFDFQDILETFKTTLSRTFREHEYLIDSKKLDENDKSTVLLYTDNDNSLEISKFHLEFGLSILSRLLYKHFDKKVIVLMDDYDEPLWQVFQKRFPLGDVGDTILFIRAFISNLLKDNEFIDKALISGRVHYSDSNNIVHLQFLGNHSFNMYYGFTDTDVVTLLKRFNATNEMENVRCFYNGYKTIAGINIFNPHSVIEYFKSKTLKGYWQDPMLLRNLSEYFHHSAVRNSVIDAIEGGRVDVNVGKVTYSDIITLKNIINFYGPSDFGEAEKFLQFLTANGYFYYGKHDVNKTDVSVPNEELRQHIFKGLTDKTYFYNNFKFESECVNFLKALHDLGGVGNDKLSPIIRFRQAVNDMFVKEPAPASKTDLQVYLYTVIISDDSYTSGYVLSAVRATGTLIKYSNGSLFLMSEHSKDNMCSDGGCSFVRISADILTIRRGDGAGIIIEVRRNSESAEHALDKIVNRKAPSYKLFDKYYYISRKVYIGLHLNTVSNIVTVCCLVNEVDFNKKICV